ncbi:MAG: BppU family phage baseplate upper protein, partial [Oscillospiraceae bacterium]|nr:BppU family phage baseplate upper protein [Oscillospiraceae bacterium]
MRYTEQKITLDIHETMSSVSLSVKKGDTARRLLIHLADDGYPYHISEDCYAVFTAKKPDGKVVFNNCRIEDCVIIYEFTDQTVAAAGLMDCEIILYGSSGQQLTSACFGIIVDDTIYDTETEVESTDEYNALADLIGKNQKLFSYGPVAQAIVRDADGAMISVTDASNQALQGLRIFGKSIQNGTPTPDNPVEIVTVGAAGGEIGLYIAGKNLFANSEMHAVDATGAEVNNGAARRTPYIPVLPGQKLAFSKSEALPADSQPNGMLRMFDKNRRYVSSITALGYAELEKVVTIPSNIYFVRFVQYGFTYVDGLKVQMEFAAEPTEYDGNTGQVLAISTPNGLPGIPVTSGGNYIEPNGQQWICDEVDFARGVYVQRISTLDLATLTTWARGTGNGW